MSLFSSILRTWSDMFNEEKVENQKLHQVPVPSSSSLYHKIDEFEDPYKEV
jgi:hypothetical protein